MPVCRCKQCVHQGNVRDYTQRTLYRHRVTFGLSGEEGEDIVSIPVEPGSPVQPPCSPIPPVLDDIGEVPEFGARDADVPVPEPIPAVVVCSDQQRVFIGRQWNGMGRPPKSFFVPSPARLEVLLDLQHKYRLGSDGSFSAPPESVAQRGRCTC